MFVDGTEIEVGGALFEGVETDAHGQLFPAHTVILVSRHDLPLGELVRRHRGKQGHENAFRGPLRELDLRHSPCRGLLANPPFYTCGHLADAAARLRRGAKRLLTALAGQPQAEQTRVQPPRP